MNKHECNKTILEDFKEKYPNYIRNDEGTPSLCVEYLYNNIDTDICSQNDNCKLCWNRPLSEVIKNSI